jgi:hypothetical protein
MKSLSPDPSNSPCGFSRVLQSAWRVLFASGLMLATLAAGYARGGDAELDRLRTEYPKALEKLERAYSECNGECLITGPSDGKDSRLVEDDVRFASSGGFRKVTIKGTRLGAMPSPFEKVYSYGDGRAFSLVKTPESPSFQVTAINDIERTKGSYNNALGRFLNAPFSAFILPMSRVLGLPTYRLRAAESFDRGGRSLVRVHLAFGDLQKPQPVVLELDPSASWVVLRSEFYWREGPGSASITADIEYGPQADGIPTPKSVRITDSSSAKGTPPRQCEFRQFKFGPTPLAEFELPYYGLPDVTAKPRRGGVYSPAFWLLGIGSAGVGLGFALRGISRRLGLAAA